MSQRCTPPSDTPAGGGAPTGEAPPVVLLVVDLSTQEYSLSSSLSSESSLLASSVCISTLWASSLSHLLIKTDLQSNSQPQDFLQLFCL